MKCQQILLVLWCSSVLEVISCLQVDGLSCVSDYWHNITCVLNITGDPEEQSITNSHLRFSRTSTEDKPEVSCPLMVMNRSFSCDCKVDNDLLSSYYIYDIYLCNAADDADCQLIRKDFRPVVNIQLRPPPQLVLQHTTDTVNITCNSRYQSHNYLVSQLEYELLLQTPGRGESKTLHLVSPKTTLSIDETAELQSDTKYCIKARYIANNRNYRGTWSEWSRETCWKHKAEDFSGQEKLLVLLAKSLGPVCLFVGVLLFLVYSPAVRMKIKTLSYTPSPAPFFQPLFQENKANLQEWFSPQGTFVLTYKTEEILTTDAIVPKPVTKSPEDSEVFPDPLVSQVTFIPVQSSYVGLPEMQKAPPPIAMVCPRDTSYTQLPCPVWEFSIAEAKVASSPPDSFLEVSQPDSGCSFEDESQSPECSLPTSPAVDISPPPLACSDYCILNKTDGGGVVPVLLSKGSNVKVSMDSPQDDES